MRQEILTKFPDAQVDITTLAALHGEIDLLINGTPVGMYPHNNEMPVSAGVLDKTKAVFDAVYNPAETLLMKTAKRAGAKTVGGMPMLVWQAAVAQEIWNGCVFQTEEINRIIALTYQAMAQRF